MVAEKAAPNRKKIDRPICSPVVSAGSANSTRKTATAKIARVRNCRFR